MVSSSHLTRPGMDRLIDADGNVACGIFAGPVERINHQDYVLTDSFGRPVGRLGRRFAYNRFHFIGCLSPRLILGVAIVDIGYVSSAFVYCYEPSSRRRVEVGFRRLLGAGARFPDTPEQGVVSFRKGKHQITIEAAAGRRQVRAALPGGIAIDAELDESACEPMRICTRAGAGGWVYARKVVAVPMRGRATCPFGTFDLADLDALGQSDFSAGFMRRETFWNWASLSGRLADGRSVGLNVSCGVNETSFTENCFWIGGKLYKLDLVHFAYDRRAPTKPWHITSFDGNLELLFTPEAEHAESANLGIVAADFRQLCGRFHGTLRPASTGAAAPVRIDGLYGYAEIHFARW